ncbi:hypothetical protein VTO42DRAFT_7441 [Malbranchea cinnamomea]
MSYFLPSFFQKRLLRYALSRLQLVDTDALDLDSLGITWGQRSTVELRDLGLQLEKLASILQLPSTFDLTKARISLLRVTIPADIYSSGIIVEVVGIQIHLRVLPESKQPRHGGDSATQQGKTGAQADDALTTILPSTTDLAQSFLESEPEETEELQAALSSQSQHVHHLDVFSDDEEEDVGLREQVSLPSFLAGFFKGVLDRLQLKVTDVTFRVDMEVPHDGSSKQPSNEGLNPVTGMIVIRDISIDGVAAETVEDARLKAGKRLATLSEMHFMLVADPSVFDSHAQLHQSASHLGSHSEASYREPPSPQLSTSTSSSYHTMAHSTMYEGHFFHAEHSQHSGDSLYSHGRFSDAATEDEYESENGIDDNTERMTGSQDDERLRDNPVYLEEALKYTDDSENSTGTFSPSLNHGGADIEKPPDHHILRSSAMERSRSTTPSPSQLFRSIGTEAETAADQPSSSLSAASLGASRHQEDVDDGVADELSESRIFTHEEAQSMYMSAMSHASDASLPQMPGAWASPKSDSRMMDPCVAEPSPDSMRPDSAPASEDATVSTPKASTMFTRRHEEDEKKDADSTEQLRKENCPEASEFISGLMKTFLSVEKLTAWIPSFNDHQTEDTLPELSNESTHPMRGLTPGLGRSILSNTGEKPKSRLSSSMLHRQPNIPERTEDIFEGLTEGEMSRAVELDIGSMSVKLDTSCGWLLAKMGQQLASKRSKTAAAVDPHRQDPTVASRPVSVSLTTCRVYFLEHLPGQVYEYSSPVYAQHCGSAREDVILRLDLSKVEFNSITVGRRAKYSLKASDFVFGHASEDIISFDDSASLYDSTQDFTAPNPCDIFVSFTSTPIFSELHLFTLPLHIRLNPRRLDETLAWFGGLSTVLELRSSVTSTSTVREGNVYSKSKPKMKQRGVHFERTPVEKSQIQNNPLPLKINCRIGGLVVDLIGEKCHLKLETETVKAATRSGIMGVFIHKGRVSGPHLARSDLHTRPNIEFLKFKLEYRFEPNEEDLDRMLNVLTPSQDKSNEDDDIMLGTLVRQRKKGGVLTLNFANVNVTVPHLELLEPLTSLGDELAKLSTVAKYIPQDDRPGIMTLVSIEDLEGLIHIGRDVGTISLFSQRIEGCFVSFPSLMALSASKIAVLRNEKEELIGETTPEESPEAKSKSKLPMIMVRYIADEMEPTFRFKLFNLRAEYTVSSLTAFLGLSSEMTAEDIAANMAHSVVNLAELKLRDGESSDAATQSSAVSDSAQRSSIPSRLSIVLKDCLLGLNPRNSPGKGFIVFTSAQFVGVIHEEEPSEATLQVQKASLVIIDDVANVGVTDNIRSRKSSSFQSGLVRTLEGMGYVPVCSASSARVVVKIMQLEAEGEKSLDIELKNDLLIIETCADSTQTLITILNGLAPPSPPNKTVKYRTEVIPIEDMLGSFSGDAFELGQPADSGGAAGTGKLSPIDEEAATEELEFVSDFNSATGEKAEGEFEMVDSFHSDAQVAASVASLDFQEGHFAKKSAVGGTAHRWDSTCNTYSLANEVRLHGSPLRVRVRDVHVIWNLFDGYDWHRTRDTISKAVHDVQKKATEKRARASPVDDDEEESVIGDFLFNSVYIGIPTSRDPRDLSHEINRNIDDLESDVGSFATSTTVTAMPNQPPSKKREKLRLARSKHHKITFELKGIAADLVVFPPGSGETQSSLDIRVRDLEIFDHLPTSTWKKFATYMHDAGEREIGANMVHLEILNVKPVADLAASELILKATILPLRLHVDQDALDFMSRFFEFKDDSAPIHSSPGDIPFIQRAEVNAIQVRLDFKPKRVDYAGLRSGRTTEFMNFFVLDEADMVLRHVIIYGISGFERLGQTLNDIWMPDIKANQLPGVLAGLAPVKSLVNIGSGFKDLVVIPMREYKKDGRVVRSIQKGAVAFAKTTTNELVKLGAKLAIGTQTVLQSAEDFLNNPGSTASQRAAPIDGREDDPIDEDEKKQISLYADQPVGVVQGLRGAYASLERDLLLARDAIVAVPGEVMESGSARGAAKAIWKRAPTVILRPAIGASKAVGQTLLGAGNTLDPQNRRRVEDKYKHH